MTGVSIRPTSIDWALVTGVVIDIAIPVLAILVPTAIAILLFRAERRDSRDSAARARQMDAASDVIMALAPMASIHPNDPMQERLWELRARIAVYRTWLKPDDISGDWLALRHREGMHTWAKAMDELSARGGVHRVLDDELLEILAPSHQWAAQTLENLSAWMRGEIQSARLQHDGARVIEQYGLPPKPTV